MNNLEDLYKNKSVEEEIASLKKILENTQKNISIMEKDLENEYFKSVAGAADYELVSDSITAMKDVMEDLQNELNEIITRNLESLYKTPSTVGKTNCV